MLVDAANAHDPFDHARQVTREAPLRQFDELRGQYTTIQDDIERLIQIAAQLFAALEFQIHQIEADLSSTLKGTPWAAERTVLKEQLIHSALCLNSTVREITLHLGESSSASFSSEGYPNASRNSS